MPQISTYIDQPTRLGRGQVGSPNIATGAIYHQKFAPGTGQHGSLDLRRAVGTISTVDVGSFITSYGSAGTLAAPLHRGRYGSYAGTVQAPFLFGRYGSMSGTLRAPLVRGLVGSHVTSMGSRARYAEGSYRRLRITGTVFANQGSFTRLVGTLGPTKHYGTLTRPTTAGYGSYGTTIGQILRGRYGSFTGTLRTPMIRATRGTFRNIGGTYGSFNRIAGTLGALRGVAHGTLLDPRLPRQILSKGTIAAAIGSFTRAAITNLTGAGTLSGRYGSYGTITGQLTRGRAGSYTGTLRALIGSFARFTGTIGANRITRGTIALARTPIRTLGTHLNGSWSGNEIRKRYATWTPPFTNTAYGVQLGFELRGSPGTGQGHYHTGISRKATGSALYHVSRDAGPDPSGTHRPIATIWIWAI